MRSWRAKVLVLIGVLSVVAAACGGDDNGGETGGAGGTATGGGAAECNADMKVGVAFDIGGLGDKSFNDSANAGLQQAIADGLVCEDNAIVNEANSTGSDRDQNVQALADAGMNIVIGVGFAFSPGINTIAPDYPDVNFMIVDGFATCGTACGLTNDAEAIPNVADFTFKEQEGSFLVGAAAVLKCQCETIGFLGGQTGHRPDREVPGRATRPAPTRSTRTSRSSSSTSVTAPRPSTTRSRASSSRRRCTTTAPRSSTTRRVRRVPDCSTRRSRPRRKPSAWTRTST